MIRVGTRGDDKFKRALWNEALGFIADKMQYLKAQYRPTTLLEPENKPASDRFIFTNQRVIAAGKMCRCPKHRPDRHPYRHLFDGEIEHAVNRNYERNW
ncbi:MAG: hypothetical protein DRR19_02655 [Candidatus Parabeggiatoa sp. nov. 1]|nr:MAG: hypothetical protein DRR19_02655 [Gammaproteobacteria bacterium]